MDEDGNSETRRTTNPAGDQNPVWSPDGTKIAFESNRDGDDEIWVMPAGGGTPTNLTTNSGPLNQDFDSAWAPEGRRIAFTSLRNGNSEIFVMKADGSGQTRLAVGSHPDWSPDGRRITYENDDDIYVMNADGSGQTNLTPVGSQLDFTPSWSPNGTKIAFGSDRDDPGGSDRRFIYVMNADGTNVSGPISGGVFALVFRQSDPDWSPDGQTIAFQAINFLSVYPGDLDGSDTEIWTAPAPGGSAANTGLTKNTTGDSEPSYGLP